MASYEVRWPNLSCKARGPNEASAAYRQRIQANALYYPGTELVCYTCKDVFSDPKNVPLAEIEPRVIAASQNILILGQKMYAEILQGRDGERHPPATGKQWRKWRKELEAAVSEKPPNRYAGLGREARGLAERAAEEMRTIERKMGPGMGFFQRLWLRVQCIRLSRSW